MNTESVCAHYFSLDFSEGFFNTSESSINRISVGDPYPIHKPFKGCRKDHVIKYFENVSNYEAKLSSLSNDFNSASYLQRILTQNTQESHVAVTRNMLEFYQNHGLDTSQPYLSDYNPFYASGLLESFQNGTETCLIRPDIDNNLQVTTLSDPSAIFKLTLQEPFGSRILGISSNTTSSGTILILVRLITSVHVLKFKDYNLTVPTICSRNFKHSTLSASIQKNQVSVVTSDLKLHIFNIKRKIGVDLGDFDVQSCVKSEFVDKNLLGVLSKTSLKLLDLRSSDYKSFQPTLDDCNIFCTFQTAGNVVYVGTRHHLLRTDIRFIKNHEFCSHLMETSPCFMDVGSNFLCLATQTGEKIAFCGSEANSLPLKVPTINETYQKCKLFRDILLRNDLGQRFKFSTVGIKIVRNSLYSTNCVGDIFKQNLSVDNSIDDPIQKLYEWIESLPQPIDYLNVTNVVDASDVRFALTKPIFKDGMNSHILKTSKFLDRFKSQYSMGNLKDVAANFVEIWQEGEDEEVSEMDLVPEVPTYDKVTSWIQSSSFHE